MEINRRMLTALMISFSGLALLFSIGFLGYLLLGSPEPESGRSPIFPIIFLTIVFSIGMISAFSAFYYYFPEVRPSNRRHSVPTETSTPLEIVKFVLSEDEAAVLEAVQKLGDRTYQFEISKITGLSRMKVHRTIKKLEDRQILKRDAEGRGSRVFFADWLK